MIKYLLSICFLIFFSVVSWGQTIATTRISTDDAPNPLVGGTTGRVILGISVDKTAGAIDFTNLVVGTGSTNPNSVFSSVELWTSSSNFAGATNTNATVTLNASNITFAGNPTNLFSYGAGAVTGRKFYVVAAVHTGITSVPTITLTLSETGTTYTGTPTETAFSVSGDTYNFQALEADFEQNAADATALADEDDVTLIDFTINSNGTQFLNSPLVFTFNTDVTNILEGFDLQVGGMNIGGVENYAWTAGGTVLTITGFLAENVTNATVFTLLADIKSGATSANDFEISLASSGVAITPGITEAFTTFTNTIDVSALEADFTQNADDATALADQNDVTLLGFTVNSNGTQSLNTPLIFTFNTNVTSILENFDLLVNGSNIGGLETYTLNGAGTQLTVAAFTGVNVTNATTFTLLADIRAGATIANDFTISLASSGVTVSPGSTESFTPFTNDIDIVTSQLSDITLTGGTTPSIAYRGYQGTTIGPNQPSAFDPVASVSLADFLIRDGGVSAPDNDNKATVVTSIQIQITNSQNIGQIALFNDVTDTEISGTQQTVSSTGTTTLTFTPSTPITIADNSTFQINVRASFKSAVTDNHSIQLSIVAVAAQTTGSGFSSVGTWASTTTASNTNIIAVVASKLSITSISPTTTTINSPFSITVKALDQRNNTDLDYTGKVDLTRTPAGGTFSATQPLTARVLGSVTPGEFTWTNAMFSASANPYTFEISDDAYTDPPDNQVNISEASGTIVITSSNSTLSLPPALNLCFGGSFQTLGNIVITETDASGFSSSGSFSLALPTGFIFDTGTNPTLSMSNSTTNFTSVGFTGDNIVQFTYNITAPTGLNGLTIAGLRIRYPGSTTPSGGNQITRSGGTATLAGVAAGTQLGTVNAALGTPPGTLGFTVEKINSGDVDVLPNETRFSSTSNSVRLVGSPSPISPATGVFSASSGVTLTGGEYRFNPSTLSPGFYDVTYTYSPGTGQSCQFTVTKTFEVYVTSITNLQLEYCSNNGPTAALEVSPTTLNSVCAGCTLQKFIYFKPGTGAVEFPQTSNPIGVTFDPGSSDYTAIYAATEATYGTYGIWIGFTATDGVFTYYRYAGLIKVKTAPTASFTTSSNAFTFCEDNTAVTLIGTPANSNNTTADKFEADGNGVAAINNSIVAGNVVWSFSPAAVTGVLPTASQSFDVTYTYKDPVNGCSASSTRSFKVKDRPSSVSNTVITENPLGPAPATSIELCQGGSVGQFSAPNLGSPLQAFYTWYEDNTLLSSRGRGNTFTPPIDNTVAMINDFYVTQTTGKEAFMFFGTEIVTFPGCESDKGSAPNPLKLDVIVNATPSAPSIANASPSFCIGQTIPDFAVTGARIKWYTGAGGFMREDASPSAEDLLIDNMVASNHSFYVTQTINGCESIIPSSALFVTVAVKPLPVVSIVPDNIDPMRICKTDPSITFRAFDGVNPALQPPGTISWTGVSAIVPDPGTGIATLNPSVGSLIPGDYTLTVNYTTSGTNCSNSANLALRVMPTVDPSILVGIACDSLPVSIENTSKMVPLSTSSTISKIKWLFGDGGNIPEGPNDSYLMPIPANTNPGKTTGTYQHPNHIFSGDGPSTISYTITTSDGCIINPPSQNIIIAPKPQIDFNWGKPCRDIVTGESKTEFTALEKTLPSPLPINTYEWKFNVNNTLSLSAGNPSIGNPIVNYTSNGTDFAELIVITAAQCRDTIRKQISILPTYPAISANSGYEQNFNSGSDNWIVGGIRPSWGLANTMARSTPSDGFAWATGPAPGVPNNDGENSWVMSGCFNLSDVNKPVISLDIWSDTPSGVDGAVLQYNIDGNIAGTSNWKVLGTENQGINWYDDSGIANSPGNQASGDLGWTGNYSTWENAIYKLDELRPPSTTIADSIVIFRIAFAGGNRQQDGFAFDNVFIGERSRVVLLENFTNSSANSVDIHNDYYKDFGNVATNELVKIQYHTAFPDDDPINDLNQQMNNSRAAFYGITESPQARLDGNFKNENIASWLGLAYDNQVLTPSSINLRALTTKVGESVNIDVVVKNTTNQILPLSGAHVFVVIVKKSETSTVLLGNSGNSEFAYIAKQMLPSAAGTRIDMDLTANGTAGDTYTTSVLWKGLDDGDAIVVFIQNIEGDNKTVYQAALVSSPPTPDIITRVEDPEYGDHISLYPNPANHEVNIELPTAVSKSTPITLQDAFGRTVYQSAFKVGEKVKNISTSNISDGIYMLQTTTPQGGKVVKKLMVKHQ